MLSAKLEIQISLVTNKSPKLHIDVNNKFTSVRNKSKRPVNPANLLSSAILVMETVLILIYSLMGIPL
jgi:hypothetical protein